ncbi:MAG: DMT family transporter [Mesorhizobium sp.]
MNGSGAVPAQHDAVDTTAAALMVFLTFSWGLNFVAAKLSYPGFSPVFLSVSRSIIGGLLVLAWCRWRGNALFRRDGTLPAGMLVGALFGVEFLFLYLGLERTTVARNTLLFNTMPFWILLLAHFLLGERITRRKLCGLALAFAGLVAMFFDQLGGNMDTLLMGDMLSLLAGFLWALSNVVIKRSSLARISAEKTLLYQLAGAIVVGLLVLPLDEAPVRAVSTVPILALLFQGAYIVGFSYVLWFWMLTRYPASSLANFVFLSPVFGVLCGAIFLGEPLTARIFVALALIAAGLLLVSRPGRRQLPA